MVPLAAAALGWASAEAASGPPSTQAAMMLIGAPLAATGATVGFALSRSSGVPRATQQAALVGATTLVLLLAGVFLWEAPGASAL